MKPEVFYQYIPTGEYVAEKSSDYSSELYLPIYNSNLNGYIEHWLVAFTEPDTDTEYGNGIAFSEYDFEYNYDYILELNAESYKIRYVKLVYRCVPPRLFNEIAKQLGLGEEE